MTLTERLDSLEEFIMIYLDQENGIFKDGIPCEGFGESKQYDKFRNLVFESLIQIAIKARKD